MKNNFKVIILTLAISVGLIFSTNTVVQSASKAPVKSQSKIADTTKVITPETSEYTEVKAIDVVNNPLKYLNKKIKMRAKFDKFSTLGLDYKPAFRSSDKYISILIKRDDVTSHTVPLSEMKIFLKRDEAEKYVDLEVGDIIEISGVVFSNALGDVWVDVEKFNVISSKSKDKSSTKK